MNKNIKSEYNYVTFTKKFAISKGTTVSEVLEMPLNSAEALKHTVGLCPDSKFICIQLDGSPVVKTYAEIWRRSERILGGLRSLGLQSRNFIIFQISTGQDFASAFWSCLMGGFIPVPVSVPSDYSKQNPLLSKLYNIWQKVDCSTILTTSNLAPKISKGLQLYSKKKVKVATIEELEVHSPDSRLYKLQSDELALLLTSSGTTGNPKLIELNSRTFIYRFLKNAVNQNDNYSLKKFLNWFPLESTTGILTTVPNGFHQNIYLPVELLIRNPLSWLDILSRHQVTYAQTTNFFLARVTEQLKINPLQDWDFSSLQKIGIGAELVVPQTVQKFTKILDKYNLPSDILHTGYGMTECGFIAGNLEGLSLSSVSDNNRFVEIGKPVKGLSIRIVDQEGGLLKEDQIGRIQVKGTSMTSGYYKAPELNSKLFTKDGWINSGDLGFLKDGKLTVTGREKETIIINAHNFSCHEIELAVEEIKGIEPSYTVACAIRNSNSDTDELAIFFHTLVVEASQLAKLLKQIRGQLTQTLGINPTYIIPLEKTEIPRTSIGKIQRVQLKQDFEKGKFDVLFQKVETLIRQESEATFVAPHNEIELQLKKIFETVLGIEPISVKDNFFTLGGDSMLIVKLLAEIEKKWKKNLSFASLYQEPTVKGLANLIIQEKYSYPYFSLVPIQPKGDKVPLFAIHLLGKGLSFYRPLANYLGPKQPIYGLSYGLAARNISKEEVCLPPIKDLAAHYIKEMQAFQPQRPYILLGVSNGGNVAFEMAKQLNEQGQTVAKLILFDTLHPNIKIPPNWENISRFQKVILDVIRHINIHWGNLLLLELKEKPYYFLDKVKIFSTQWLPQIFKELDLSIRSFFHDVTRKQQKIDNLSASFPKYIPQEYSGRITLFKAKHTALASFDPTNGWEGVAKEGIETYIIHGAHSKILCEPSIRILAKQLKACLHQGEDLNSTINSISELQTSFIKQEKDKSLCSSLVTIQTSEKKSPFFFINSVGYAHILASHLGQDQPFYCLSIFELKKNLKNYTSLKIEDIAVKFIEEMQMIQPEGPYFLGAFCADSFIVFEMAQLLHAQGKKVALLTFFDAVWYSIRLENNKYLNYIGQFGYKYILDKVKDKFISIKEKFILRLNQKRANLYAKQGKNLSVYLQNVQLLESFEQAKNNYTFKTPYKGKITLFLSREFKLLYSPKMLNIATEGIEIYDIPSYHQNLFKEPYVYMLAEKLRDCIAVASDPK